MSIDERAAEIVTPETTRLEFELSMQHGNCNILAAQTAMEAEKRMQLPGDPEQRNFIVLPENYDVDSPETVIASGLKTPAGREVRFSLVQPLAGADDKQHPMLLGVITRDDLLLPLASFARREVGHCDFVQIGDDMNRTVAVPEDEMTEEEKGTRKQILQAIRDLLKHQEYASGFPPREVPKTHESVYKAYGNGDESARNKSYVEWIGASIKFRSSRFSEAEVDITAEGLELLAAYMAAHERINSTHMPHIMARKPQTKTQRKRGDLGSPEFFHPPELLEQLPLATQQRYQELKNTFLGVLRKHPAHQINPVHLSDVYCSLLDPLMRTDARGPGVDILTAASRKHQVLLEQAQEEFKYQREAATVKLPDELFELLDVDAQLDEALGKYDPNHEIVIRMVGQLAAIGGSIVREEIREVDGIPDVNVEIALAAVRGNRRMVSLQISNRLKAMTGSPFVPLYKTTVDYSRPPELSVADTKEVAGILGQHVPAVKS